MLVRALAGEKFSSPGGRASPLVQPQGFSGSRDLPGPSLDEGDVAVRDTFHDGRLLDPLTRLGLSARSPPPTRGVMVSRLTAS